MLDHITEKTTGKKMSTNMKDRKITTFFAWYDFWIGLFYDKQKKILYFCPLPCIVIKFEGVRMIDFILSIFGMLGGAYIGAAILFKDINIKRGVHKWVDRIVKEAFEEI